MQMRIIIIEILLYPNREATHDSNHSSAINISRISVEYYLLSRSIRHDTLNKWMGFHQYDLQMNQFGKFRRREPYIDITDNDYIKNKFGIFADNKLYSYAL